MMPKRKLKVILADHIVSRSSKIAFLLILLQVIVLALVFPSLPPQVPLFYSLPWGEARLGPSLELALLPLISIGFGLIAGLLALFSPLEETFLYRMIAVHWVFGTILTTVGLLKIIFLML